MYVAIPKQILSMYNREKIIATMHEIADESNTIKPYVIICQPRRIEDEVPAQKLDGYHGLHVDFNNYSHAFANIYGKPVDVARNYLMEIATESEAEYLMFIGEDTVLPYYGFNKLHETAKANPNSVVVGVYYIKASTPMIAVNNNGHVTPANVDQGQVFEAWMAGMDAMLIPIKLLREMKQADPELPFTCISNGIDDLPFIGEDNFFIYRLRKHGYKLLCDTDVQCLHVDIASGKYTAHPDVDLGDYFTNFPITERITVSDKNTIDKRWVDRLPTMEAVNA